MLSAVLTRGNRFKRNQDISEASGVIKSVCLSLIQGKREKLGKGVTDRDILSVALESGGFSDDDLVNQMMTFLVAGHETTASSLVWSVYLMCKHPEIQERLRAEIHSHLPNLLDGESTITSTDIDCLPYLNAVCSEVLRLFPPVSLTVRETVRDTTILGHVLPKGTSIIIPPWAVNTSKALWGSNSTEFDPGRWTGTGKANTGGAESNYSFLTFLHGPRSCIGQAFAKAELACLLAAWIGTFETTLGDPKFVPEIRGGISAKPHGGLHVIVKRVDWQ
jgi:cytochrome P450